MFNSYSVTPNVDARTTNNSTLNFNSVSGTLCKSHPKSVFVWFQLGSNFEKYLMCANPKFNMTKKKDEYKGNNWEKNNSYERDFESVVVLQTMLTGEDRVIAEIVRSDDFYEPIKEITDGE